MPLEKVANALVLILLVAMMVAAGLRVTIAELFGVVKNARLVMRGVALNYLLVPAITILLLKAFHPPPLVAAGFVLVSVCPAAPFAPALTAFAKGNVPASVGLMVILAGSSALLSPLLLNPVLKLVIGSSDSEVHPLKIVTTLLVTQLLPLASGLMLRSRYPLLALRLQKPANALSGVLSIAVFALLISLEYRTLADIRVAAYVGICLLVVLCLAAGWILGGRPAGTRAAVGLTTAARNIGVALAIATECFPDTAAVTSVIVMAIVQTLLLVLLATTLGRFTHVVESTPDNIGVKLTVLW